MINMKGHCDSAALLSLIPQLVLVMEYLNKRNYFSSNSQNNRRVLRILIIIFSTLMIASIVATVLKFAINRVHHL